MRRLDETEFRCPDGHPLLYHPPSNTYACSEHCAAYDRLVHERRVREERLSHEPGCEVREGDFAGICTCRIIRGDDTFRTAAMIRQAREDDEDEAGSP